MSIKYDFLLPRNRPSGIGNNLYLLGTSEDGPTMEPIYVREKEEARQIFGSDAKGTLVKAFDEAYDRNKELNQDVSIYLMRITGKRARLDIEAFAEGMGYRDSILTLEAIYGGEKYNQIEISYFVPNDFERYLQIKWNGTGFLYPLSAEEPILSIVQSINRDCRDGKHPIQARSQYDDFSSTLIGMGLDVAMLQEGDDETTLTRNDMYLAADMAYTLLLGREVDIIVPVDMYLDDVHPAYLYGDGVYGSAFYSSTRDYLQLLDTYQNNKVVSYHEQLIDFCREQLKLGFMTHGVIGIRPLRTVPKNIENDNSYILRIIESTAFRDRRGIVEWKNGYWVDKGFYISVVASEVVLQKGTPQEYFANGAIAYATLITGHYDTTTNLSLGNDIELRYELSEATMNELSKFGIVTFRQSVRNGLVVTSGVTPAMPETDYHSFANVRMVQLTIAYMNDAVELVYEGELSPEMRRTFLEDLVKERLSLLQENQVLTEYDYEIQFLTDYSAGEILLSLQTKYTVQGISTAAEISSMEGQYESA